MIIAIVALSKIASFYFIAVDGQIHRALHAL
jgi:hypothetical protein